MKKIGKAEKIILPHIGLRIVKSAVAVALCFMVSFLRGNSGIGVNSFSLPKEKKKDILFISGLDDILLNQRDALSDYSRVELNRMLDEKANFTISTIRTPASLVEVMKDIRLKFPVIVMDGAVLYDIEENRYLKTYVISHKRALQLLPLIKEQGLQCFTNVIVDDLLVIYYEKLEDDVQKRLLKMMRKSPYRNYVQKELGENQDVVYFMLLYPRQTIEKFYAVLEENKITEELKVLKYDSVDYPGYSYIKIYNKNAKKENMIDYLKEMLEIEKTVTFGSIPGRYDEYIMPGDTNQMVRSLKKRYEPVKNPWKRT